MARLQHNAIHGFAAAGRLLLLIGAVVVGLSLTGAAMSQTRASSKFIPEPGFYSVNSNNYNWLFLNVGSKKVLNIAMDYPAPIACAPAATGAPTSSVFLIPQAAVRPNGSFSGRFAQSGMFDGSPATFTYSFAGQFTAATSTVPASAAGTYREDIVFKDNVTHKCTTNNQSWKATKAGAVPQPKSLVRTGSYNVDSNNYNTFAVSANRKSVQNVSIAYDVPIVCSPAESGVPTTDKIVIPQAAIRPDGSFAGESTQHGVFGTSPAKISYLFSGNFQGLDSSGRSTAYGLLRADIAFSDAAGSHHCTSNTLPWYASAG